MHPKIKKSVLVACSDVTLLVQRVPGDMKQNLHLQICQISSCRNF